MSNQNQLEKMANVYVIIGLVTIFVLFAGFGLWAINSEISGAVVASGKIEVENDRQVVQHEDGGVALEILVNDGDKVALGDVLIKLDPRKLVSQKKISEGQLYDLIARRGRLEALRDEKKEIAFDDGLIEAGTLNSTVLELMQGQQNLFSTQLSSIAQKTEQLGIRRLQIGAQIIGFEAQRKSLRQQLEINEKELMNQLSLLERGLTQNSTVSALQREKARIGGMLGELGATKAEAGERLTETTLEVLKVKTAVREDAITQLRDLLYREFELTEKRSALNSEIEGLDIRAPVSGIVHGLDITTPFSIVRAAKPLLYLIPQDRPLIFVARVMPSDIDRISFGLEVNLRLSALDQQTTPELTGKVMKISANTLEDQVTREEYFKIDISLNPGELDRLPDGAILIPGMPVQTLIISANRSAMSYIVKPISDYFALAFRED